MVYAFFFLILLAPTLYLAYTGYVQNRDDYLQNLYRQRSNIVSLGSLLIEERFDRLVDIANSLATRVQMRRLIAEGKWFEAIDIIKNIPPLYPDIDRIFFTDPAGVEWADTPHLSDDVIGQSFAHRDWYKGVSNGWKPYVSEAFRRAGIPQYNVINVATPIYAENTEHLGILVMQIQLASLENWAKNIHVGGSGYVYFVDQNGHPIGHPQYPSSGDVGNMSHHPIVSKALARNKGVEQYIADDGTTYLAAYAPVNRYGWSVVVEEDLQTALAVVRSSVFKDATIAVFIVLLSILIVALVIHFIRQTYMSQQRQRAMLQGIGDGVIAIDRNFNIIVWNKAASFITGFAENETIGKPLRSVLKLLREEDGTENITFLEETMLFGEVRQMGNHTVVVTKAGNKVPVADSSAPIFDQKGNVVGAIIVFRDVTKERQVEKAKDEFISLASHQLRTPLTGMKWILETLHRECENFNERQKEYMTDLSQEVKNLSKLVNALLNTSRIDLGALTVEPEPCDFADLMMGALKELEPNIAKKKLHIKTHVDKDLPVISADPKMILVVFQNLFSNAVKYSREGGLIGVQLHRKDPNVEIIVSDDGVGIPAADQPNIFGKLFRAENVRDSEGTGLGLYMVKSILEASGGTIHFESQEDKGTTFIVTLPLVGMKAKKGTKKLS